MTTIKTPSACRAGLAVAIAGSLCAGTAKAQLAGHNVILVHGFQQEDLADPHSAVLPNHLSQARMTALFQPTPPAVQPPQQASIPARTA